MSEKTLKGARGLNSIADPASFRGATRRSERSSKAADESSSKPAPVVDLVEAKVASPIGNTQEMGTRAGERKQAASNHEALKSAPSSTVSQPQRSRRELTVPYKIHDLLEATMQNATDVVMRAVRNHGEEIMAGDYARGIDKGRKRLRITMSDEQFAKIAKIGRSRGWNQSETVAVLLFAELGQTELQKAERRGEETNLSPFPI